MTLTSAAILLFLVMDPLGNIPIFLTTLARVSVKKQKRVVIRELLIALGVLMIFLFTGQFLLDLLRISEPALTAAGGVILLMIAIRMVFPSTYRPLAENITEEPFIVPLAIPYVAGPSTLATELLLMSQEPGRWYIWLLALLIAWTASSIILYFASNIGHHLNERGLIAIERLMGMILITVSIQMLMDGIEKFTAI